MIQDARKSTKKCASELKKIREFITAEDRKQAIVSLKVSYVTISRYLQGKVANPYLGVKLLDFFTQQLKNREAAITVLSADLKPLTNNKKKA